MPEGRPLLRVLVSTGIQLLLLAVGVGMVVIGRVLGIDALFWIGLAVAAATIAWIFISCILHGINPLDP